MSLVGLLFGVVLAGVGVTGDNFPSLLTANATLGESFTLEIVC